VETVLMHLQRGAAVLKLVFLDDRAEWQLPGLPRNGQPHPKTVGDRRTDDKSARLDPEHLIDLAKPWLGDLIDDRRKSTGITDERGDVAEQNPWFGKIRNIANQLLEFVCRHDFRRRANLAAAAPLFRRAILGIRRRREFAFNYSTAAKN